mmetsp:Transcript_18086/g.58530  ORF Transcript_18086/g.58530 Transcript_18086/m.58530 type:complete len:307 (+) Transcript_18086:544-1464(+)
MCDGTPGSRIVCHNLLIPEIPKSAGGTAHDAPVSSHAASTLAPDDIRSDVGSHLESVVVQDAADRVADAQARTVAQLGKALAAPPLQGGGEGVGIDDATARNHRVQEQHHLVGVVSPITLFPAPAVLVVHPRGGTQLQWVRILLRCLRLRHELSRQADGVAQRRAPDQAADAVGEGLPIEGCVRSEDNLWRPKVLGIRRSQQWWLRLGRQCDLSSDHDVSHGCCRNQGFLKRCRVQPLRIAAIDGHRDRAAEGSVSSDRQKRLQSLLHHAQPRAQVAQVHAGEKLVAACIPQCDHGCINELHLHNN